MGCILRVQTHIVSAYYALFAKFMASSKFFFWDVYCFASSSTRTRIGVLIENDILHLVNKQQNVLTILLCF